MEYNPFTLLFGKEPSKRISRIQESDQILSAFFAPEPTQQVFLITGIRGNGKTVFMTEVAARIAASNGWIVVELNPHRNLLEDLVTKLNSNHFLNELFVNARINLSFWGLGINFSGTSPITNIEIAASRMLESIKKHGKKVLITIDEVVSTPAMREFAHTFQIFIRQDLPVFLLMTGLYHNIDLLQNEEGLTFLYPAPKIELKPLSQRIMAKTYSDTFSIPQEQGSEMARITRGYPFAFQVLGYLTWENHGAYLDVIEEYKYYLADYSYDKVWSELSSEDKRIASGIAASGSGKIADIRKVLNMDTNHFNPYRKRLIKKGIVTGEEYGYLHFVLPYFAEYVMENYSKTE